MSNSWKKILFRKYIWINGNLTNEGNSHIKRQNFKKIRCSTPNNRTSHNR
jgi:hypothetical protein